MSEGSDIISNDPWDPAFMAIGKFLWRKYQLLPERFRMAVLVRSRAELWRKAGLVFIHIPKAAGTSINVALYGQFMGHPRASDIKSWAPADVKALPSFAVTRNPWDRLVSAYRFSRRGRGVGGAQQAGVWRPQQYRIPEFETFERFVCDWLVQRDATKLDRVFQPQSSFVCGADSRLLVDHVGRLENLGPTYAFVRRHLGRSLAIGESNRSGETVDYRRFYTPRLVDVVADIYSEDVQRFGYSFG